MNFTQSQSTTSSQELSQKLSPQMRQSVEMLAMSLPELRQRLYSEMASNPAIDDIGQTLEKETVSQRERELERRDESDPYPYENPEADGYVADEDANERRRRFFDSRTREETLDEHLASQIAASDIPAADAALAELLIGELDDDGYFRGSIPDVMMVSGESEARIRKVLAELMRLDPPGCGASTIEECLLAQLDKLDGSPYRDEVEEILRGGHLKDIADGNREKIERTLGTSPERYDDVVAALRTLDPRPARAFSRSGKSVAFVKPEVRAVRRDGRWIALVDDRSLPEIRISPRYLKMLEDPSIDEATKEYVRNKIASARFLIAAVEKRRDTIIAISQAIFDAQPGFFEKGLKGLRPLTMQQVAEKAGVHHTTVSRTVRDKYASTPRGTVELRRFFVQAVETAGGGETTRQEVLDALSRIVSGEDRAQPLSDGAISAHLKKAGYSVARRTVSKYRSILAIPDAAARKKA